MRDHERLEALQALRAIAAGLVVLVHAFRTQEFRAEGAVSATLNLPMGDLGVKLFFCISGFIIVRSAFDLAPGVASLGDFVRRRLIRIVPLYWMATLVYAAKLSLEGEPPAAWELLCSMFFIPYADAAGEMRPVLGLGWTLNFEMFFYATVGVALLLAPRLRLGWVLMVLTTALVVPHLGGAPEPLAGRVDLLLLSDHRLLFFVAGMLIARVAAASARGRPPVGWPGAVGAGLALITLDLLLEGSGKLADDPRHLLQLLTCSAVVALAVSAASSPVSAGGRDSDWPVPGWSGGAPSPSRLRRWIVAAGDGSYSTYLFHGFVIGPASRLAAISDWPVPPLLFALAMLVVCTMLGVFIFRVFEAPVGRWLTRQLVRRSRSGRAAVRGA